MTDRDTIFILILFVVSYWGGFWRGRRFERHHRKDQQEDQ
jgi:hypothetical protein